MTALVPTPPAPAAAAPASPSADELARRFTERWAASARYVAAWDRWMVYDGVAWRPDVTLRVLAAARGTCRKAAGEVPQGADTARVRARLGSLASVVAVERLARLDRRHLATAEQWDADPWLLNTPDGTVDLRTGDIRPHKAADYITRTTSVAPDGECPRFLAALARGFGGDAALVGFVQRALGSALAGAGADPTVFFACGPDGSGKSLLLDTAVAVLGGYAAMAPLEALIATPRRQHEATLARIAGARLVITTEDFPDRRWNAECIRAAAGGAPIARMDEGARQPGFKLFVAGSHPPALRAPAWNPADAAIRRRLRVIPFGESTPEQEADADLPQALLAERPGILAWMMAGCRDWQRSGLAAPQAVLAASADYLAQEDIFADWLADHTRKERARSETAGDLYRHWAGYATKVGEPPGSRRAFARALQERGFVACRLGVAGTRGYKGILLCELGHDEEAVIAEYQQRVAAVARAQAQRRENASDASDASVPPAAAADSSLKSE